jgi:hypothetical protein
LAKSQESKLPVNFRAIRSESPTLTSCLFKDPVPFTPADPRERVALMMQYLA